MAGKRALIIDSFAGGGGASTGIEMALGRSSDYAINHSAAALALHEANHPETVHLSENIWKVDPLDHVKGKHVGLAWFSPDCKHFSKAKGGKPVERNVRDLAWVVVLWAERARPNVIILENVEEFRNWGPLLETGKGLRPCPDKKGETFEKWAKALRRQGYRMEWRELRACDFGAPTIRKRFFMVARRDGKPVVWPEPTHGAPDDPAVIAGKKKPWRTAAEIIEWSQPCPSIFDSSETIREKFGLRAVRPLAGKTLARIARGMEKFVLGARRPFLVNLTHGGRLENPDRPLATVTGAHRGKKAIVVPVITAAQHGGSIRDACQPIHTITAGRKDQNAVILPHITAVKAGFVSRQFGTSTGHGLDQPAATVMPMGQGKSAIVAAYMAQYNGQTGNNFHAGRPADMPLSTITAKGSQQNIVIPHMIQIGYGEEKKQKPRIWDISRPVGTLVSTDKHAVVSSYITEFYGNGSALSEREPCHTISTHDRFAHTECALTEPHLTDEQWEKARLVAAFLRDHGIWDQREFVTLTVDDVEYIIWDIGMRMLTPRELFNAQGFPSDYRIDISVDGKAISRTTQVSCVGNSVSPPVAEALVRANCRHLIVMAEAAE